MLSPYAFCMLTRLRQSYTRWQWTAGVAVIAAAINGASCSDASSSQLVDDAGDAPADEPPANDAPSYDVPNDELAEDSPASDGSVNEPMDSADAAVRLCVRLSDPNFPVHVLNLSADVRNGYLRLVAGDCSLDGLFPTRSATLAVWSNRLYDWNLDLWGCTDRSVTGFALVPAEVTELTSADAALLIDDYLSTATTTLKLSRSEATWMRQELVRLGTAAITRQSDEHPYSACGTCDAGHESDTEPSAEGGCPLSSSDASATADQASGDER